MSNDNNKSLNDEVTLSDSKTQGPGSLGKQLTFGENFFTGEPLDNDFEVVDLTSRYKIERELGQGGMGRVMLATDTRLNRKVAIKRILEKKVQSQTVLKRFLTEAKSIAALNHPNIVQIYDYGRAKDGPFLIMEYVDGCNLQEKCRDRAMSLDESVELTCKLCEGLAKAHAAGIIHRDIKPANILLTLDGVPKLTDFGLAKAETSNSEMTITGAVLGTLDFMPPEQRKNATLTDTRSDLWSLASTLYQMVTGESPRVLDLEAVPKQLRPVMTQALKSSKEKRFQSAGELKEALKSCLIENNAASRASVSELGAGECPKCKERNESSRKFCNGCGTPLQVECFACGQQIPIWDRYCGECGENQTELINQRQDELEKEIQEAESLCKSLHFKKALDIANKIKAIDDIRFSKQKEWAEEFIPTKQNEWYAQKKTARNHLAEAKTHRKAYDYHSALHAIEKIPQALQTTEISEFLRQLKADHNEFQYLTRYISQQIEQNTPKGLLSKVERALELKADQNDLKKLKSELIDWESSRLMGRDKMFKNAQQRFYEQDYSGALAELKKIDADLILPPISQLEKSAKAAQEQLIKLQRIIENAVKKQQYQGLLTHVNEYLKLKSDDESMLKLQNKISQLIIFREKAVENARERLKAQDYVAALREIESIDPSLMQQNIKELQDQATETLHHLEQLKKSILRQQQKQEWHILVKLASEYQSLKRDDPEVEELRYNAEKILNHQREQFNKKLSNILLGILGFVFLFMLIDAGIRRQIKRGNNSDAPDMTSQESRGEESPERDTNTPAVSLRPPLLIMPFSMDVAKAAQLAWSAHLGLPSIIKNEIGMEFVLIPPGEYLMGSPKTEIGRSHDESQKKVLIREPFYLSKTEVTQKHWVAVMGTTPWHSLAGVQQGADYPAVHVSWSDVNEFISKLSRYDKAHYRLPTESEWEYACRAGSDKAYSFAYSFSESEQYVWFDANTQSSRKKHAQLVGIKLPNQFGLYDMHGNVWELCEDTYSQGESASKRSQDNAENDKYVVIRGGSWTNKIEYCRSAYRGRGLRSYRGNDLGFRVVLIP